MDTIGKLILSVKRGNSPFHRFLRRTLKYLGRPPVHRLPRSVKPLFRFLYECHFGIIVLARLLLTICYRGPLFSARCAKLGKNVAIDGLPFVSGHVQIEIGDNVWLGGNVSVMSGRLFDQPRLVIGDSAEVGWNVGITVNCEVIIEDHARVAYDCRISDSDAHPKQADLRAANCLPPLDEVRPVRICRNAWIGNGSHILKGVTVGEGAIIGANSVVVSDVPPFALAVGNPARVFLKDVGLPSTAQAAVPKT